MSRGVSGEDSGAPNRPDPFGTPAADSASQPVGDVQPSEGGGALMHSVSHDPRALSDSASRAARRGQLLDPGWPGPDGPEAPAMGGALRRGPL
eukprot:2374623-Pyramimonas_sp.AAC.1